MNTSRRVGSRFGLPGPFVITFAFLTIAVLPALAADVTLFGPRQYVRQSGKPAVVTDSFAARKGAARLEVMNGAMDGSSRVSSAVVILNGRQILGPSDFNQQRANVQLTVELNEQNTLSVELRSAPGSRLAVRVTQEAVFTTPFREAVPAWAQPDLAVTSLTIDPDRCDPGQAVTLRAVVANAGTAPAGSAFIGFQVDGNEISRLPVPTLGKGAESEAIAVWTAEGPGRHAVTASLIQFPDSVDRSVENDSRHGSVRVSGLQLAEVEYKVDTDPTPPIPGQPATFSALVRNAGFVPFTELHVRLSVNDQPLPPETAPGAGAPTPATQAASILQHDSDTDPCPRCSRLDHIIPSLNPGESTRVRFTWADPPAGEFIVRIEAFMPDGGLTIAGSMFSAFLVLTDSTTIYDGSLPDQWTSMGPSIITQTKSGGRMDSIAIHPTTQRLYAASPFAGVWRFDPGGPWEPKGDKLSHTVVSTVAVDPGNPDIVYCAAGNWGTPKDLIYKSIDGGTTWRPFTFPLGGGVTRLVVRRTSSGGILIYAASAQGVLRYSTPDPLRMSASASDWYTSLTGDIRDMVVHPTDNSIVYAVRYSLYTRTTPEGYPLTADMPLDIMRTQHGENGTQGNADWTDVSPYAFKGSLDSATIDLSRSMPAFVYAALRHAPTLDKPGGYLIIYSSQNQGASGTWSVEFEREPTKAESYYNAFVRVHPKFSNVIYYGGIKLYRATSTMFGWYSQIIPGVHDDQRELVFASDGNTYYALTDGGIWAGYTDLGGLDLMLSLNYNLRTHMFFHMDASQANPDVMIAGLQDNGTLRYQTSLDWKEIRSGDGLYSLIVPGNDQVMYSQYQFLTDTRRSNDGGDSWATYPDKDIVGLVETPAAGDVNTKFIAVDPDLPHHIMAQGQVPQVSWDSGKHWAADSYFNFPLNGGPVRGDVTQFQFLWDSSNYLAGTSGGQVWFRKSSEGGGIWRTSDVPGTWVTRVARSPIRETLAFVLSIGIADERVKRFAYDGLFNTWSVQNMTGDLPVKHLIADANLLLNAIAADPCGSANVVYVGTDKGVFRGMLTESGNGYTWQPYNLGLPLVNVTTLVPVMATQELRAATYGRGVWTVKTSCTW